MLSPTGAAFGELDGVADQIDDDLPQAAQVANHLLGHLGVNIAGQFETLLLGAQGQHFDARSYAVSQVELDRFQFEPARFDLGEVEHVVDDR